MKFTTGQWVVLKKPPYVVPKPYIEFYEHRKMSLTKPIKVIGSERNGIFDADIKGNALCLLAAHYTYAFFDKTLEDYL